MVIDAIRAVATAWRGRPRAQCPGSLCPALTVAVEISEGHAARRKRIHLRDMFGLGGRVPTEPRLETVRSASVSAARRAIRNGTPTHQAIAEVRRVSDAPVLLGVAAGRASGRWTAIPLLHSIGQEVAELLIEAGADRDVCTMRASSVERRLRRGGTDSGVRFG
jgi:hypothetical protein